jgi:hypothetical protein
MRKTNVAQQVNSEQSKARIELSGLRIPLIGAERCRWKKADSFARMLTGFQNMHHARAGRHAAAADWACPKRKCFVVALLVQGALLFIGPVGKMLRVCRRLQRH